ncbi:hypothetical protein PENTCL1PPCAC_12912, partial [Pristionchus entomophagus]
FGQYSSKVDIFALGLILTEMCVVLSKNEAEKVFDGCRSGRKSDVLNCLPEVKRFVNWLTNVTSTERPGCKQILDHEFFGMNNFTSEFFKKFKIRRIIAQSRSSIVFEACNLVDGIEYAVKRVATQTGYSEYALKEIRALASMKHENILSYNNAWIEKPPNGWQKRSDRHLLPSFGSEKIMNLYQGRSEFIYIQTELCKDTLADWLRTNKSRNTSQTKLWFKQIVSAVAYIHQKKKFMGI